MTASYRLERFITRQDEGGTYEQALAELRAGAKRGHWMWFVFPQIEGLGTSAMAREYAISGLAEARAYLDHPVLGPRLRECAATVAAVEGKTAREIFGSVDAMKLRSSMTLFEAAALESAALESSAPAGEAEAQPFAEVLTRYFDGQRDEATLSRL